MSALSSLTSLTYLGLSSNNIIDVSALASLTTLTDLSLGGNNISDVSALASLTTLTELWLNSNNISDVSALASLTTLTYLNLGYNNITTGVTSLVTLTNATTIDFTGNPGILSGDLDTLEAALGPGIVIRP